MRNVKIVLIAVLLAVVFAGCASALTEISAGPQATTTLATNGETYTLAGDIFCEGTAFIVSASNITFDGMGHTITYANSSTGYGFVSGVPAHNNNVIKNVSITHTGNLANSFSVYLTSGTNNTWSNLNISTINGKGIYLVGCPYNNVLNCAVVANSDCVTVNSESDSIIGCNITSTSLIGLSLNTGSFNSTVANSSIRGLTKGTSITGSVNVSILNSTSVCTGTLYGLLITNTTNSVIRNSTFNTVGSAHTGLLMQTVSTNNSIENCLVHGGILLQSDMNRVTDSITDGGTYGLYVSGKYSTILNNTCVGFNGIWLEDTYNNIVENCTGCATSGTGLNVKNATNSTIANSSFTSALGAGFSWVPPHSDNHYTNLNFTSARQTTGQHCALMVGDSITENGGASGLASYGAPASAKLTELNSMVGWTFVNVGIGGSNTTDWILILDEYLELYHPKYVILMIGTNDIGNYANYNIKEADVIARTFILTEKCRSAGAEPIIMAVTPRSAHNADVVSFNRNMSVAARNAGYVWLNSYDAIDSVPRNGEYDELVLEYYGDAGLHPNALGHSLLGAYVGTELDAMDTMYNAACVVNASDPIKIRYSAPLLPQNTKMPFAVAPSKGAINVTVTQWEISGESRKIWTESSETHDIVTSHIIGGFPADTTIYINRDGVQYDSVVSNETGFIDWVYEGGYSEHTFEAYANEVNGVKTSLADQWATTIGMIGVIILIAFAVQMVAVLKGKGKIGDVVGNVQGVVYILILLLVGTILFSQLV